MTNRMSPPATPSAAAHAERIRARTEERAAEQTGTTAGQSTAERIAAQILPGYRADEALRQQARLGELRARGVIGDAPEPEDVEAYEDEAPEDVEEEDEPTSTAERYARRERARQKAEHTANRAAQSGAVRTWSPTPVVRPHRHANGWGPKPAA